MAAPRFKVAGQHFTDAEPELVFQLGSYWVRTPPLGSLGLRIWHLNDLEPRNEEARELVAALRLAMMDSGSLDDKFVRLAQVLSDA